VTTNGSGAPKCKLCGASHWGLCAEAQRLVRQRVAGVAAASPAVLYLTHEPPVDWCWDVPLKDGEVLVGFVNGVPVIGTGQSHGLKEPSDRKDYLKLKARERRAARKAGLSVKEYRGRQGGDG
jgi:hypothetical protein